MTEREYQRRKNPLLEESQEGRRAGYDGQFGNPYDRETQFDQYVSWEEGWADGLDDKCLEDMGR